MKKQLEEIYDETIIHSSFLDKKSIEECMTKSYNLGREDVINWFSKMKHLSDNIDYLIDEFRNQN